MVINMTSKERVRAAVHFLKPDRLPVDMDSLGHSDIHYVNWNQIGTGDKSKKFTLDEWGCGWSRTDVKNMGQVTYHPLDDWNKLDTFEFPNPDSPEFFEGMERFITPDDQKYVITSIFMVLFERLHSLRGFENVLVDLYDNRDKIEFLADKIVEFDIRIIENISSRFPGLIDGINFSDDWGTELNLMISPKLWIDFFKPRYKRIFDACKKAGWDIWLHSCGKVNKIIPELIDLGVDVVNLQQPRVLGIEEVGKQFAGKICFLSLCDIQRTLPFENDEYIREEAKLLLENWGTPMGGFVLGDYGDGAAINVDLNRKEVMYSAFVEADYWRQ